MAELFVNLDTIFNNAVKVQGLCQKYGISICSVVKGCNALDKVVRTLADAGLPYIGTSRLSQLKSIKASGIKTPLWMLRIPEFSLIDQIVENSELSLVSEISALVKLNEAAKYHKKKYEVMLMIDIGDLREGFWPLESIKEAAGILDSLDYIDIKGVGMNASCYGSVVPSPENTGMVVKAAEILEDLTGKPIKIRSGGNTTSLKLLLEGTIPKGINNLRIGEAILLARDLEDLWHSPIEGTKTDSFTLKSEIIEVKSKPSHPIGEMYVDAFAGKPIFEDRGIRKRALAAVGRADFLDAKLLVPCDKGIEVLGCSSDHLILDVEECPLDLKPGDFLKFELFYGAMLGLTNSKDVTISYLSSNR